jgi:hypothetical protein
MLRTQIRSARPLATRAASTTTILCGLALTGLFLPSDDALAIFSVAAIGVGLSLIVATVIESMKGVRNLIRVDLLCLWALYGLTFFEFLFPQAGVDTVVSPSSALSATYAVLLGFVALAVGRHLVPGHGDRRQIPAMVEVRPSSIFLLFMLATLVGYLHVFLSVNFDPIEALRQMSLPRFSQSWGRGQYGDAYALLYELGALIYLIPPIGGLVYARSQEYSPGQKIVVTVVVLFTFYYGFSSGTRNILAAYGITFLGVYFLTKTELTIWQLLRQGLPMLALLFLAMRYMLRFRNVGLGDFSFEERLPDTVFIDNNMVVIARLTDAFPNLYSYLGFEIPYMALIHVIPRAIWPGKPIGLSVSIETVMEAGSTSVTFACTFIGEAYMAGGLLAVLLAGLVLGAAAEMWNRIGRHGTQFSQLLYASGFLCAAITMRSILWFSVAMLPTLALWLYGKLWFPRSAPRPFDTR